MPSFGEKLRKEREQRKITLDDISSTTKISTRMLRALEDEHFDQLPGGVFNKGFVRAYARHIGLDEEQAITDYLDATNQNPSGTTPASVPDISAVAAQAAQMERLRSLNHNGVAARVPWEVLAALLLLLAIVLVFWSYRKRGASVARPEPTSQKESVSRTSSVAEGATPASGSPATPAPDSASSASRLSSGTPPDEIASPAPVNNAAETSQLPASAGPPASLVAGSHAFTLVIRAAEDSWLSIATDAKSPTEETLIAGQQLSIPAGRQIVIKAGNVGGLVFLFNGKQLPSQGDLGQVKTLLFDSQGVRLSAHAPARP